MLELVVVTNAPEQAPTIARFTSLEQAERQMLAAPLDSTVRLWVDSVYNAFMLTDLDTLLYRRKRAS